MKLQVALIQANFKILKISTAEHEDGKQLLSKLYGIKLNSQGSEKSSLTARFQFLQQGTSLLPKRTLFDPRAPTLKSHPQVNSRLHSRGGGGVLKTT